MSTMRHPYHHCVSRLVPLVLVGFVMLAAGLADLGIGPTPASAQEEIGAGNLRAEAAPPWVENLLPDALLGINFMALDLWQWAGIILIILVAYLFGYVISAFIVRSLRSVARRTRTTLDDALLIDAAGPLRLAVAVFLFFVGVRFLALDPEVQARIDAVSRVVAILAMTWLSLRLVDTLGGWAQHSLRDKDPAAINTLVPLGKRLAKVFLVIVAFLTLLQNLGFNIAGLVAGLGVGGLAIALAAQKTVENFFGGVMVIADRPVKVGDFCRVGEHIGHVEDIGIRSTRIRSLDRTLVTIPNAEFSTVRIENFGVRDKMRLFTILQFGYDTSPDQVRYLLVEIRKLLYAHPKTLPDPCRIRFINFGPHSLDLEIFAYIATNDWNEFLAVREDIFLRIIDIVKESGAYFAYPSQTLYLGRDAGRDLESTRKSEETVRRWREEKTLMLPEFTPEAIAELDDSLPYPPPGSPALEAAGSESRRR